jgi:hypothetical protein
VQSIEQRTVDQVGGPDHRRRLDQESASNTADGETDDLCGHDHQPLVSKVGVLVVIHALDGYDIGLYINISEKLLKRILVIIHTA